MLKITWRWLSGKSEIEEHDQDEGKPDMAQNLAKDDKPYQSPRALTDSVYLPPQDLSDDTFVTVHDESLKEQVKQLYADRRETEAKIILARAIRAKEEIVSRDRIALEMAERVKIGENDLKILKAGLEWELV